MRKIAIAVMVALVLTGSAYADFNWFNTSTNIITYNGSSQGLGYSRTDSSVGCFVQLIWAGLDNQIDAAVNSGSGVTDDDQVQATSWVGRGQFGSPWGIVPTSSVLSSDSNGYYYVRAWSAPSPDYASGLVPTSTTNYYGNSALWSNPGNEPGPDEFNFGGNSGWSTSIAMIPEPAMLGLGLLGLVLLRLRKRA